MLVATYAKQTGRVVAYSLAAFRQAFAAGRDLGERDWVLDGGGRGGDAPGGRDQVRRAARDAARLDAATAAARAAGVRDVPAVRVGDAVFHGDDALEAAAGAIA